MHSTAQGRRSWRTIALATAAAAAWASFPARAHDAAAGEWLRRLADVVGAIHTASWTEESWERSGGQEERSRVRCLWTDAGRLRLDVLEGRLPGTRVWLKGEEAQVSPPGLLSPLRLRFRVDAPNMRSLRGNDLRSVGFIDEVRRLLREGDHVRVEVKGDEAVVAYPAGHGLWARMWLAARTSMPLRVELADASGAVERRVWRDVVINPVVDPRLLDP